MTAMRLAAEKDVAGEIIFGLSYWATIIGVICATIWVAKRIHRWVRDRLRHIYANISSCRT